MAAADNIKGAEGEPQAQWYYLVGESQIGPVAEELLARSFVDGTLDPDTCVWRDGLQEWCKASEVSEFSRVFDSISLAHGPSQGSRLSGLQAARKKRLGPAFGLLSLILATAARGYFLWHRLASKQGSAVAHQAPSIAQEPERFTDRAVPDFAPSLSAPPQSPGASILAQDKHSFSRITLLLSKAGFQREGDAANGALVFLKDKSNPHLSITVWQQDGRVLKMAGLADLQALLPTNATDSMEWWASDMPKWLDQYRNWFESLDRALHLTVDDVDDFAVIGFFSFASLNGFERASKNPKVGQFTTNMLANGWKIAGGANSFL